ncbi:hypothetical protein ACFL1B_01220 [Nanoarchaeota archaeon]
MVRKHRWILIALFLIVFLTRLYFAFQDPYLTADSYYYLRHIEHIQDHWLPMYEDPLSYGSRIYYFPPLFHYFMATITLVMSLDLAVKVIPSLLFSLMIFLAYATAYRITKSKPYSIIGALFFAFTPISYIFPINNLSPYSLALPLFFSIIYLLTGIRQKTNLVIMIILITALVFTHPSAFLLVIGLLLYVVLLHLEHMKLEKKSAEVIFFTIFLVFWALFIIYKNVFLLHGIGAVWQNIPADLIATYFPGLTVFEVLYFVGIVPLTMGVFAAYINVFKEAKKHMILMLAMTLAIALVLWLSYMRLESGLLFLSFLLSVLAAQGLRIRADYVKKTKLSKYNKYTLVFIVLFFVASSVIPVFGNAKAAAHNTPSEDQIKALEWIQENTPEDATILATLQEGHLITYFGERKNVLDSNFILISRVEERFIDVNRLFTFKLESEAVRLLDKYDVNYIFFSNEAKETHGVDEIIYVKDQRCFEKVYDDNVQIFKVKCKIK